MNTEAFYINNKTNFFSIFWEILCQEKSSNIRNKVFIQKRKEALLKQQLIDIIDPIAIRKDLNNRIYLLEKKNKDRFDALHYASSNLINLNMDSKKDQPSDFTNFDNKETIELCSLKQKLALDDNLLIEEEKQNILHKLDKKDQEYLSDYLETKIEHYKKWGTISYRSIGTGIGAVIGSIVGTMLFPGLGTSLGAILGGGIGGVLGLIFYRALY